MVVTVVYDKAKWHYEGDWPKGLRTRQAFVHTGMFLAWIVERDLLSAEIARDYASEVAALKAGRMKGAELLERIGGSLTNDDLTEEGNQFAKAYFDFERGKYLDDYERVLADGLPSLYHVSNTYKNYRTLRATIDERYAKWKARQGASKRVTAKSKTRRAAKRKARKPT